MKSSDSGENRAAAEAMDDQSVGSMLGRLLRRFDQLSERQSQDGWALQALNERIDKLAERLTAAQTTASDGGAGGALDRLESRLDAIHFAIGAAPRAISSLGARLDALSTTVASKIGSASEDADHAREEFAAALADKIGATMKVENRALSEALQKHGDRVDQRAKELTTRQDAAETALRDFCEQVERLAETARHAQPKESETSLVDQIGARIEEQLKQSTGDAFDADQISAMARGALTGPLAAQTEAIDALGAALAAREEELAGKIEQAIAAELDRRFGADLADRLTQPSPSAESVSEAVASKVEPRLTALTAALEMQGEKLGVLSSKRAADAPDAASVAAAVNDAVTLRLNQMQEALEAQSAKLASALDAVAQTSASVDLDAMAAAVSEKISPRLAAMSEAIEAHSAQFASRLDAVSSTGANAQTLDAVLEERVKPRLDAIAEAVETQAAKVQGKIDGLAEVAQAPDVEVIASALVKSVDPRFAALTAAVEAQTSKVDRIADAGTGPDQAALATAVGETMAPRLAALTSAIEAQAETMGGLASAAASGPDASAVASSVKEQLEERFADLKLAVDAQSASVVGKLDGLAAMRPGVDADALVGTLVRNVDPRFAALTAAVEAQASKIEMLTATASALPKAELVTASLGDAMTPKFAALLDAMAAQGEKIDQLKATTPDADGLAASFGEKVNPRIAELAETLEVHSSKLEGVVAAVQESVDPSLRAISRDLAGQAEKIYGMARSSVDAALRRAIEEHLNPQQEATKELGARVDDLATMVRGEVRNADGLRMRVDRLLNALTPAGQRMIDATQAIDEFLAKAKADEQEGSEDGRASQTTLDAIETAIRSEIGERLAAQAEALDRVGGHIAELKAASEAGSHGAASQAFVEDLRAAIDRSLAPLGGRLESLEAMASSGSRAADAVRARVERLLAAFGPVSQGVAAAAEDIRGLVEAAQRQDGAEETTSALTADALSASLRETTEDVMREVLAAPMETMASRLDALAKLTSGDSRSAEALRGRIERLLAAFQPVSQDIAKAAEEIQRLAAVQPSAEDQQAAPIATEAFETALRDAVAEPLATMAVRLDEVSRLSSGGAASSELLRSRIERLLAAFHPVSKQIVDVAEKIDAIAEGAGRDTGGSGPTHGGDQAVAGAVVQQLQAIQNRLDEVAKAAYDNSAPIGLRAVAEGLGAQRAALEKLMTQLEAQMTRGAGMAASQEQVRRRVDALFLAARQLMNRNGAETGAGGALTATPLEAFAAETSEPQEAFVEAEAVDADVDAGATIEVAAAPAETAIAAEIVEAPVEAATVPVSGAAIAPSPGLDAATAASLRFAASFQVLYRRFADVVARFEASNSGFDVAGLKLPARDLVDGGALSEGGMAPQGAGEATLIVPGQNMESAAATSMRLVVGFKGLFKRFAEVVERLEAAADRTPGAERQGELASPADVAVAALSERVEEISEALLAEREALLGERSGDPEEGDFDVRLAKLEAATLEVGRHKEEFLAIAAATTRALEQAAHGEREASAA